LPKSVNRSAAAALLVLSLAVSGCSLLPREEAELKPPLVKPATENYRTAEVAEGTVRKEVGGTGAFESLSTDRAQLSGQAGRLEKIEVQAGDSVQAGDVLARLLVDGLDLQVKEQELAAERAAYALKQLPSSDKEGRRLAGLQLDIEQLKYERLKEQLDHTVIRAKLSGVVTFADSLQEGDLVAPYQTLAVVSDPSKLRLAMGIDSGADLGGVKLGSPAEVKIEDKTYAAKVVQTPDSAPQTPNKALAEKYASTLYLSVQGLPESAGIGTQASVLIITEQRSHTLVIPKSGLRTYQGRTFVRLLEDGKRLREADVEAGISSSTEVEILKGLKEGQVIVLQ